MYRLGMEWKGPSKVVLCKTACLWLLFWQHIIAPNKIQQRSINNNHILQFFEFLQKSLYKMTSFFISELISEFTVELKFFFKQKTHQYFLNSINPIDEARSTYWFFCDIDSVFRELIYFKFIKVSWIPYSQNRGLMNLNFEKVELRISLLVRFWE